MKKILICAITIILFTSCSKQDSSSTTPPAPITKNNSWCKNSKSTLIFNGSTSVSTYSWNGNTCTNKDASGATIFVATYNDYGKELAYTLYNSDGSVNFSVSYEYTDCGNWCKKTKYTDNTNTPAIMHTFSWSGNTSTEKDPSGKTLSITVYNDYGKPLTITSYNPNNGNINGIETYEYTDCTNWCKETKYSSNLYGTTLNISTWNGNIQTTKDGSGLLKSRITYNDYGISIASTVYNADGSAGIITSDEYSGCK